MFVNRWRLVCHTCGERYPEGTAISISKAECCKEPILHVHDMEQPCKRCEDPVVNGEEECEQCGGSGEVAGDYFADDGMMPCDVCHPLEEG